MPWHNYGLVTNRELKDEIIRRSLSLLKRSGLRQPYKVDDDGSYERSRAYKVENVRILEDAYILTVYIIIPGMMTDIACAFYDPKENYAVVRHWNAELVVKTLEVLRRSMILDDLTEA